MINFGNLPPFEIPDVHESISVTVHTIQNGFSPFRALVSPAEPSAFNTLAYVLPGDIAPTSVAQGEGLDSCIALDECLFVVFTRDENGNTRFNDGNNPNLEISFIGSAGWTHEGRINSVLASELSSPVDVSQITSESNDWQYIGQVDVMRQITSESNDWQW